MELLTPPLDFNNPAFALIQLALAYFLPILTGLISDRYAKASWKIIALGALTVITAALVFLSDIALANAWATLNWVDLINVIVNAGLTFLLAQGAYQGIIKPTGQAAAIADHGVSIVPADRQLELAAAVAESEQARETLARRVSTTEAVATRVATAVVEQKLAEAKKPTRTRAAATSAAKSATKPAAKGTAATK